MADGDRAVEARALHPTARAWLRRRGARGQGHAPTMTLGPHLPRQSGLGRRSVRRGEEDDTVAGGWLTCGACVAATAGEADERVGVSGVLGRLVGRVRVRWVEGRRGWAGWAAKPSRPRRLVRPPSSFSFSILFFFSFV